LTARDTVDLQLMRASLLLDSDPGTAARDASKILMALPGHPEANLLLAAACRKFGDPAAAAAVLESLPAAQRDTPFLQLELGRAYAAADRGAQALEAFQRAVTLDPRLADAWKELAHMFFAVGDIQAGDEADLRYRRLTPEPPELADATGALADNRLDVADSILRGRLRQAPHDVVALRMLASVADKRNDFVGAEWWLNQCLAVAPGYAPARHDLAQLLYREHRNFEVIPLVDRLLATEPRHIDYLSLKAQALRLINRNDEAIALMEQLLADHPDDDDSWILFGHTLRGAGQQARAIEMYRRAIFVRPNAGPAYSGLANLKTFRFSDTDVAAMQDRLKHGTLRTSDRIHFEFALGKALEDQRQFPKSFEHYARGNALQRATINYDPAVMTADIERAKDLFTAPFFADRRGWGSDRDDPIFVVGLPRSGSTLIEQILASHSQVEGTRELNDLPAVAMALITRSDPLSPSDYLKSIAAVAAEDIATFAGRYLKGTLAHRSSNKPRFVDKMLGNFAHIGLIHLMFPRASIIDARRHPLGCGFSCYKQLFARDMNFAYDLAEIGRFYSGYAEFMAHFDAVLPARVHRVYYERLVADPQAEVERLLAYCGLPFEAQCLQFYENRRVVLTISSEQVRQPIYSDSVDQWRHFEPWLGPLKDAANEWVERYPSS
jgi:predicted Zn-dependent protease